jgi:hypothetical protein
VEDALDKKEIYVHNKYLSWKLVFYQEFDAVREFRCTTETCNIFEQINNG